MRMRFIFLFFKYSRNHFIRFQHVFDDNKSQQFHVDLYNFNDNKKTYKMKNKIIKFINFNFKNNKKCLFFIEPMLYSYKFLLKSEKNYYEKILSVDSG